MHFEQEQAMKLDCSSRTCMAYSSSSSSSRSNMWGPLIHRQLTSCHKITHNGIPLLLRPRACLPTRAGHTLPMAVPMQPPLQPCPPQLASRDPTINTSPRLSMGSAFLWTTTSSQGGDPCCRGSTNRTNCQFPHHPLPRQQNECFIISSNTNNRCLRPPPPPTLPSTTAVCVTLGDSRRLLSPHRTILFRLRHVVSWAWQAAALQTPQCTALVETVSCRTVHPVTVGWVPVRACVNHG